MDPIPSISGAARRYPVLRFCSAVASIIGAVSLAGGGLLLAFGLYGVIAAGMARPPAGINAGFGWAYLLWSLGALGYGVVFLGLGALTRLMIHLEENTRASARLLGRLVPSRPDAPGPGDRPSFTS